MSRHASVQVEKTCITVAVDSELRDAIREVAHEDRRTMASYIRVLLERTVRDRQALREVAAK